MESPVRSDFAVLTSTLCIVHRSRPLGADDHCSVGSPDTVRCTPESLVNYSGVTPRETRERLVRGVLDLGTGQCPVRQ
jgi:hypothetical protein